MAWFRRLALLAAPLAALAAPSFFPLKDVRPGQHGVGRTVFAGTKIEEFQVEILGVLENIGPRQSVILARLSGGPLAKTGVMQGMSGSPVFIDGRLLGAVALTFAFSTDPIAGIQPIEQMLEPIGAPRNMSARREAKLETGSKLVEIATPVSFGGFTAAAIDHFSGELRALGLEPVQGISNGGSSDNRMGDRSQLQPGSMISVQLMRGDLTSGADGTLTYVDGDHVYAFGHRFLSIGSTQLPFARAEVLALLPNLNTSFKICEAREWMGTITDDGSTGIRGTFGKRTALIPISIDVNSSQSQSIRYRMEMVNDPVLSPLLLQMALFSSLDANARTLGASSVRVHGRIEFENQQTAIQLDNMYSADNNAAVQAAVGAAIPLAYALQSGIAALHLKRISLTLDSFEERRLLRIEQVSVSPREVQPGHDIQVTAILEGDNGQEIPQKVLYHVPVGAATGTLYFTVSDASAASFADLQALTSFVPKGASQVIEIANRVRDNTVGYVRVWRADQAYQIDGRDLPSAPPSIALLLARSQSGTPVLWRGSKVAELQFHPGEFVLSGSKTVQVEIKD